MLDIWLLKHHIWGDGVGAPLVMDGTVERAETAIHSTDWWYEKIAAWLLKNPEKKVRECAADLGVSLPWISCLITSDTFRDMLRTAKNKDREEGEKEAARELYASTMSTEGRLEAIANGALDEIGEKLQVNGEMLSLNALNETAQMALKALGLGKGNLPLAPVVNNTVVLVNKGDLVDARNRIHAKGGSFVAIASETSASRNGDGNGNGDGAIAIEDQRGQRGQRGQLSQLEGLEAVEFSADVGGGGIGSPSLPPAKAS